MSLNPHGRNKAHPHELAKYQFNKISYKLAIWKVLKGTFSTCCPCLPNLFIKLSQLKLPEPTICQSLL